MSSDGKLLRILGVGFGIAVSIGGTVGVGILRTPGIVAAYLPSISILMIVWVIGGIYALFGTFCVVELGTKYPKAGGWYVYAQNAFGNYPGFLIGWCDWIMQAASLAYLATAIGEFSFALNPAIPGGIKAVGASVLLLFAFFHCFGIRSSSRIQKLTSLAKGIALLAFVVACFLFSPEKVSLPKMPVPSGFPFLIALILALQSIIITYDGWYTAVYFTEEDKDPVANLPKSAITGIICTIVIYLLVNAALVYVLPMPQLAGSELPAAIAAQKIFGGSGGKIITIISLVSLLSVINAVLLLAARILYGLSRDRLFVPALASVSKGGTPIPAMLLTTIGAVALVLTGTFERLIAIAAFFNVLVYSSGFLALFVLHKKPSYTAIPAFRAWGYPWVPLIALIGSLGFLVGTIFSDRINSGFAIVLMILSYPIFRLTSKLPAKILV
jgi:APA family basic amino acid/polyamine antiporter